MNETQLCAIEQSIRDEHHSELRWPHYVLLDLIAEIRRLRGDNCNLLQMDGTTTPLCNACLECAFLRGAEAMRETAMDAAWNNGAMYLHMQIRDLPVPEDESPSGDMGPDVVEQRQVEGK